MAEYVVSEELHIELTGYDPEDDERLSPVDMGAVALVRCRDCKHYDGRDTCDLLSHEILGRYDCPHMSRDWYVEPGDYCAWGARRKGA